MKFSIITPSYNSEKFIAETIESVITQKGEFEIEYIIIDGGSTDNSVDIIKKYEQLVNKGVYECRCKNMRIRWLSEKDNGMYDAINKGFSMAVGDICAWINADDIYLPGAFDIVEKIFKKYPEVKWLKGITSYINESSTLYEMGNCFLYNQRWIQEGIYGRDAYFIQQDSVFWRSELWKSVGGIDSTLKLAGDYYLWKRFAEKTPLFTVKAYLSCFRKVEGQLSQNLEAYKHECTRITGKFFNRKVWYFLGCEQAIPVLLRPFFYRLLFGRQELFLIELIDGQEPALRRVFYYKA